MAAAVGESSAILADTLLKHLPTGRGGGVQQHDNFSPTAVKVAGGEWTVRVVYVPDPTVMTAAEYVRVRPRVLPLDGRCVRSRRREAAILPHPPFPL